MEDQRSNGRIDTGTLLLLIVLAALFLVVIRGFWGCSYIPLPWDSFHWWMPRWGGLFSFGFVVHLGVSIWVWLDANKRGMQGFLWGLLVFFTSIVGLLVYLIVCTGAVNQPNGSRKNGGSGTPIVTPPPPGAECRACKAALEADFKVCPYCGETLSPECKSCGRNLESGWKLCPYCGSSVGKDEQGTLN